MRGGKRTGSGAKLKDPLEKRVKTSFQIPKWLLDKLGEMADQAGCSKSDIVVERLTLIFKKKDAGIGP